MAKRTEQTKINKMAQLKGIGKSSKEIAEIIGVNRETVKRLLRNRNPRKNTLMLYNQIAIDRTKMTANEVASKYGYDVSHIRKITSKHPLSDQFVRPCRGQGKRRSKTYKPLPKKKEPKYKNIKDDALKVMEKGHVKLQKGETILPTRIPKAQRSVPMYDSKNTIKFVDLDDPRSNEEIRSAWKEEQEKKLRSLAS